MSADPFRRYGNLLRSDGTNQLQRLLPGLDANYIVPDERSLADLLDYAYRVAAEIRFYDLSGQAAGDWSPFLEELLDSSTGQMQRAMDALLATRSNWPPHLVLFVVFLKLFQNLQGDLNQLTAKHLRYYYEQVLGLQRRPAAPDDVHVLFELAKNAAATLLPAGTRLDAGKDDIGQPLTYATQSDLVVSPAAVADMRRMVVEQDKQHHRRVFVADGFTPLEGASGFTFGRRQLDLDPTQRFMSEAPLGFAVAAPILAMAEGGRTVTVLAHLRASTAETGAPAPLPLTTQRLDDALDVAFTGADGWVTPNALQAQLLANDGLGQPALSLVATLDASAPAIVAFDGALHGSGPIVGRPVVRCLVRGYSGLYDLLEDFVVEKIELTVNVTGVHSLVVQSSEALLDSNQPMPLFGSQPQIGASFYIGSTEVFGKKLSALALHLEWKSPPEDLFNYYRGYFDFVDSELSDRFYTFFLAELDLLYDRTFRTLAVNQTLFAPVMKDPSVITVTDSAFDAALGTTAYVEQPDLGPLDAFTPGSRFGFARLVLREPTRSDFAGYATAVPFEAFGHSAFPRRYAKTAIDLSKPAPDPNLKLPNDPYTPVLSSLSLDYTATAVLTPGDRFSTGSFFVMGPFGATPVEEVTNARVVPAVDGQAALFLGVSNLRPPSNLSLFFQIDVGTATAAEVLKTGDTEWSYLAAKDAWQRLPSASVLTDSTEGFQKPGLVALSVPGEASIEHQSMPSGLVWLRALIRRAPESAARTLALKTNAALARFQPGTLPLESYAEHLQAGLPAGTVTRLVQRNANIKGVQQPDPSFGGLDEEGAVDYSRRCSERLRHRNRAVTMWDFERLVLQHFPEVFKAKCLPHTDETGAYQPGSTAIVIVPNLRRTGGTNVLEPRAGEVLMVQVRDYLASLASPFATLHVIHPVFERIRVEAQVVFTTGRDPGFYATVLNEDLRRFLSPWAYADGEDILFGARIYRSEILAFIEGREYVDHLTGLKLYHSFDGPAREGIGYMTIGVDFIIRPNPRPGIVEMQIGEDFVVGRGVELAETTQAHAILVSHPSHLITPVAAGMEMCPGVTRLGIGYMTVGLDFNVELSS